MSEVRRARERLRAIAANRRLDAELEAEMAAHLEMAIEDNLERGLCAEEARRLALVRFGALGSAKDRHREARGLVKAEIVVQEITLEILWQDVKYSLRTLVRDLGFTTVAVLILALGIGANAAVFSVVNTLLLRPLPFPDAGQLQWIAPPPQKCGLSCATYSTDAYDEFRMYTHSYQDVTGYFAFSSPDNLSLALNGGGPIPATGIDVIANFFDVLGVKAAMGRTFTAADGRDGAPPVILLSDPWWRRQFNADPAIVGKAFDINGKLTTVIGVLPRSFDFGAVFSPGAKIDAITPLDLYGPPRNWGNIITLIGRLKPGVMLGQSLADAKAAAPHMCWNNRYPDSCGDYGKAGVIPVPLKDYVSGKLRRSLVVLWSAVGTILLIACVNLSNLLLARAVARSKEFAMRSALGASRGRIVRQLLTESLLLSGAGAVLGLLLAFILVRWLAHQGAIALPLLSGLAIDRAALGWTVLIAAVAAVAFGLFPGLRIAGGNLQEALKDSGPGSGRGRRHERVRAALVISEIALACMLLVGAGLLLRSFMKVLDIDLGFQPERAAAIKVLYDDNVPNDKDGSLSALRRSVLFQQILSRVGTLPGVEGAGLVDFLPLGQNREWGTPLPKGIRPPDKLPAGPLVYVASPGYLHAMGTRIRGRDFAWSDGPTSEHVVMINKAYAGYIANLANWPNGDAVGKILFRCSECPDIRVVGVVDDVHEENVEGEMGWQIYYPMTQEVPSGAELVVRTQLQPSALASSVLGTLRELNPKQPAAEFKPVKLLVSHAVSPRRFFMILVGVFAGLGLLLAALGIYGVISYTVTRQTQEIGIRMALGAGMGRVQREVLAGTLRLAIAGIAVGLAASLLVARLIASLLFGTSPWDLLTYVSMSAGLLLVAALAGYIPARRASRISPMVALRAE
jgi:predicted permease